MKTALNALGLAVGLMAALVSVSPVSGAEAEPVYNREVLRAIQAMPKGGGYFAGSVASRALTESMAVVSGQLKTDIMPATPSYCSGATYHVFLRAIQSISKTGAFTLDSKDWERLLVRGQRDGEGVWGRWNANGPGTARLFQELNLGTNFTDWSQARPGDFMKIFWTKDIGAKERGHSVVYLGTRMNGGVEEVSFWSSNQPGGYGEKTVPRSKIAWALFSRLERPANVQEVSKLRKTDDYLANLLRVSTSLEEVTRKCAVR